MSSNTRRYQSSAQAFYLIDSGSIDEEPLEQYQDWVGVFKGDVCVGSWPWQGDGEFTTVPAMGEDGEEYSEGYLITGDYPTYKIYDGSEDIKRVLTICFRAGESLSADNLERILSFDMGWMDTETAHDAIKGLIFSY